MIPRDIHVPRLCEALLGPDLEVAGRHWLADFEKRIGADHFDGLKQDFADLARLAHEEPADLAPAIDDTLGRWAPQLATPLREAVDAIIARLRIPTDRLQDLTHVMLVLAMRLGVRKQKDHPDVGRAYTLFRQCFALNPRAMHRATSARRQQEIDAQQDPQAQERHGLDDLALLLDLPRALEGDSLSGACRRLHDVWWKAYERPVARVANLLWRFAQECREPGGAAKSPPSGVGPVFDQAQQLLARVGLQFPFEPQLREIRNALHGRQTCVDPNGTVEFLRDDRSVVARLTVEELYRRASRDVAFAVVADQALLYATVASFDDAARFDEAWGRLHEALMVASPAGEWKASARA